MRKASEIAHSAAWRPAARAHAGASDMRDYPAGFATRPAKLLGCARGRAGEHFLERRDDVARA